MLDVGLDLSRKQVEVCLISDQGELIDRFTATPDRDGLYGLARRVAVYGADSSGRRNTRLRGVAMGRPKRRRSDRAGRPAMRSPGRPPGWRREHRQRFWAAIARGATSEAAACRRASRRSVGVRWFREGGGMPSVTQAPLSGRYLSFAEREEIALLRARGRGVREIARRLGRSPSTISSRAAS